MLDTKLLPTNTMKSKDKSSEQRFGHVNATNRNSYLIIVFFLLTETQPNPWLQRTTRIEPNPYVGQNPNGIEPQHWEFLPISSSILLTHDRLTNAESHVVVQLLVFLVRSRPLHEQFFAIVFCLRRISTDYYLPRAQSTSWCYHDNAPSIFVFVPCIISFCIQFPSFLKTWSIERKLYLLYS